MFDRDDDNEKDDFFSAEELPEEEVPVKEPKAPGLQPDDPNYWEQEESEWRPLVRRRRRYWIWLAGAALVVALLTGFYLRYFSPYVTEAVQYGYIESVEHRGTVFKTYEGVLIPYRELMDTTRVYSRDFVFTAADKHVAKELKRMEMRHIPVRVEYKRYHAVVPWRGASTVIVTRVDSADASRILPPEFAPRPSAGSVVAGTPREEEDPE